MQQDESISSTTLATETSGNLTFVDPYYVNQWAPGMLGLTHPDWTYTTGVSEVKVAVLDTGIDKSHEDLDGKIIAEKNLITGTSAADFNGHGTHIAGIIAARPGNGIGIAGIAPYTQLMNVKVADDQGRSQSSLIAEGIIWATDNGARVINISIAITEPAPELEEAVDYAWNNGAVVIAAASNQTSSPVYPASYKNCIAVVAVDQKGQVQPLSYDLDWIKLAAPGISIFSTLPGNSYGYKNGTSMAAAHVSGLAALMFGLAFDRNEDGKINDEIRSAIESISGKGYESGIKIINAPQSISKLTSDRPGN